MRNELDEPVVLGTELAAAEVIEQIRRAGNPAPSPLAELRYAVKDAYIEAPGFGQVALDTTLRSLMERWRHLPVEQLTELRGLLSTDDLYTLLTFARRTTLLGLRSGDPGWPRAALTGLTAVTLDRIDHRDLRWAAGLVGFTLDQVTSDETDELIAVLDRADRFTADILGRAVTRPPSSLEDCRFVPLGDGHQMLLAGHDGKPWCPTIDLASIAQAVAAAIEAEGSHWTRSIEIATHFPPNWLRGSPDEEVGIRALDESLATASLDAQLVTRPGRDHMFVIWMTECTDARAAELIARSLRTASGSFARLAATRDALVCGVIARSVVAGRPDPETNDSLRRFERSIVEAIASVLDSPSP